MSQKVRLQFYDINGESVHDQVLNLFDYLKSLLPQENTTNENDFNNRRNNIQLFLATELTAKNQENQVTYNRHSNFNVNQLFPLPIGSFFFINDRKLPKVYSLHIIAYENKYLRYHSSNYLGHLVNILLPLLNSLNNDSTDDLIDESDFTLEIYLKNKYKAVDAYLPVAMRLIETSNFIKCFDQSKYIIRLV